MVKSVGECAVYQTSVAPVAQEDKKGSIESGLNVFKKLEKEGTNKTILSLKQPKPVKPMIQILPASKPEELKTHPQETQQIAAQKTEKEEIENRSGHLWECIGRKPDTFGGYIYQFKLKKEFDDVTPGQDLQAHKQAIEEKNKQIFPAEELSGSDILFLDPKADKEEIINVRLEKIINSYVRQALENTPESVRGGKSDAEFEAQLRSSIVIDKEQVIKTLEKYSELGLLGYEMQSGQDEVYLNLPDREALLSRWRKLQETRPELPDLDIFSSEGIAGDLEYVDAYLKHHALLSNGKEFVHDSLAHLIMILSDIMSSGKNGTPSYKDKKEEVAKSVTEIYHKILKAKSEVGKSDTFPESQRPLLAIQFKEIEMALGALVDSVAAIPADKANSLVLASDGFFKQMWYMPMWKPYFDKRFGAGNINSEELSKLWDKIQEIEL